MREVTLTLTVRVPDSVLAENVAQQIGDAIGPDGWSWDVSFPAVTGERTVPYDEVRIAELEEQRDEGNDYGPDEARELAALTHTDVSLPGEGSHDRARED